MKLATFLAASATLAVAAPAAAHHGNAAYDMTKEVTVSGAVKSFDMGGAHGEIQFTPANGRPGEVWGIEAPPTHILVQRGWSRDSLKPGQQVSIRLHPNRDGSRGGKVIAIIMPDGSVFQGGRQPPVG
jgi:hypothetical protein